MKPSWLYKLNSKEQPQKDMNIDSKIQQQHHEGSRPASAPALWEWSN